MAETVFPTKGNLIAIKRSLSLAKLGYDLMDRKRNILIREMMGLIDTASKVQGQINDTYARAYNALQKANITLGIIDNISKTVPIETGINITSRSVMGVEIPIVTYEDQAPKPYYSFSTSNSMLDDAYISFYHVKQLTAVLAEIENSVYRLANSIRKTQRRANALKNIIIPRFEENVKFITEALEEKEREEFSRQKVIGKTKERKRLEAAELESETKAAS
ncbi:V-type ATP synthase subunit D [Ethanoligenens harbinense]|uniref:V-type ATP synthase subunit D n=1 Tax=Ethanoligenens harbinense (strain DSM 18485 / JCM 12961 / CGMCC 1.5033 / YUAN-3) TaxID=663278 RepID=E6U368_ETHHY|nr:V-type ATP synthase subunit D [Ethanoligenens harbinense]ADU27540.1 V-type ATPase, D subunit [Ethanoligenens harbinense YUAN-3]AVQ96589.1 V-type ATP synthase subunit D [Ethanoligenens harbinense YUAN-3]AYF39250.1 V-type ATP synthase subunit D [Ethanoligenens harbinense]AYF42074.1 V-type ATP synthase subunit D [Ethanoligenens harbinense]QCN92829.1 V-type ATP synthase subunit D [Ethanoligenens harbinense]